MLGCKLDQDSFQLYKPLQLKQWSGLLSEAWEAGFKSFCSVQPARDRAP